MMRAGTKIWGLVALATLSFSGTRGTGQTQHAGQQFAQPSSPAYGQTNLAGSSSSADATSATLPDSPGAVLANSDAGNIRGSAGSELVVRNIQNTNVMLPAHKNRRIIRPYEEAAPLDAYGKIELSIMSRATPGEAFATVFSAGWSQLRDSRPHYGRDTGAFEKRLGALAIKQTSQSFFSYGVYAAAFHDDPRYYVMGSTVPLWRRAVYSGTRTFITQKDDATPAINWPRLAGIATATALTNLYYPKVDRGFGDQSKAFAVSIGTSVMNDELHEFLGDAMRMVHRNR